MNKKILILILFLFSTFLFGSDAMPMSDGNEVLGYWVGYNDQTNVKNSIIYVYRYNNEVYGRILVMIKDGKTYDSTNLSGDKVMGFEDRNIEGLDFMWGLKYFEKSKKWDKGKIIDPENGKVYASEMHVDPKTGNLITKGKIWIFGRSKTWTRAKEDEIPKKINVKNFVPDPPVKEK